MLGFEKRKRCHLTNLRKNKHHSKLLQNAWNKYGETNFKFEILELCNNVEILDREQYWINFYNSYDKGYNATPIAGNCRGRIVKDETRLKISNSLSGRNITRSSEHNNKLTQTKYKVVLQYDDNDQVINKFESANMAARILNVSAITISSNCTERQCSKSFKVRYEKDKF